MPRNCAESRVHTLALVRPCLMVIAKIAQSALQGTHLKKGLSVLRTLNPLGRGISGPVLLLHSFLQSRGCIITFH